MGDLEIAFGTGDIMGAGSDIAAKEASGYGPPRLAAGERTRLEPAPCAEPISEDGFHWGVAKR